MKNSDDVLHYVFADLGQSRASDRSICRVLSGIVVSAFPEHWTHGVKDLNSESVITPTTAPVIWKGLIFSSNGCGYLLDTKADPKSVAGVRVRSAADAQSDGTTRIARDIKVVTAATNRT